MCVIIVVEENDKRPSDYMLEKAFEANDDGAGVAWREKDSKGKPYVQWQKGIFNVKDLKDIVRDLPVPFTIHCRVASIGAVCSDLTHPFPINDKVILSDEGKTYGEVLFHNGTWQGFQPWVFEASIRSNTKIPVGLWSDSRAIAFLMSIYGHGLMNFLPKQKGVAFGPEGDPLVFLGEDGWEKVNGIWCSNDYFMKSFKSNAQSSSQRSTQSNTNFPEKSGSGTGSTADKAVHPGGAESSTALVKHNGTTPLKFPISNDDVKVAQLQARAQGGSSGKSPIPFPTNPSGQIISLEIAERLKKQGAITGQLLKRIRRHYSAMASTTPKTVESARNNLLLISQLLTASSAGSVV